MSLINFGIDFSLATQVSGTGSSYTCPTNKKSIVLITMSMTYQITGTQTVGGFSAAAPGPVTSETYTFLEELTAGDVLAFSESGASGTGSKTNSYNKNGVLKNSKTYTVPAGGIYSTSSGNITYTAYELPL